MELVDYTDDSRVHSGWMNKDYYTLVDCNPLLLPLLRFLLDLLYNVFLFLHIYIAVGKMLTDTLPRSPSAVAELFVRYCHRQYCNSVIATLRLYKKTIPGLSFFAWRDSTVN